MKLYFTKIIPVILIGFIYCFSFHNLQSQCNGALELCDKKYNEVAYLTTHNAYNAAQDSFEFPNQNFNIATQLSEGVRGLMIDVYDVNGESVVYHSFSGLGSAPFQENLSDIKAFLDENPNEIVTIILECYTSANAIENDLEETGLMDYLYTFKSEDGWQSLQEMIDSNDRLVILSDKDDATEEQAWYHYVWDLAVETHYSAASYLDFSCDYNRGDASNDLFILNHFISGEISGDPEAALLINEGGYLSIRAIECQQITGKLPNFVTVDFYELGNTLDVVNELNRLTPDTDINSINANSLSISVYPNPTQNHLTIENNFTEINNLILYSALGERIHINEELVSYNSSKTSLDVSQLATGFYFIKMNDGVVKFFKK